MNGSRLKSKSSQTILFLWGNRQSFNAMHMRLLVACEMRRQALGYDLLFSRFEYSGKLRPNELVLPRMLGQTGAVDGVLQYVPSVDAASECKVQTNVFDSEYDRFTGGVRNAAIKSGMYSFQGILFNFTRNCAEVAAGRR